MAEINKSNVSLLFGKHPSLHHSKMEIKVETAGNVLSWLKQKQSDMNSNHHWESPYSLTHFILQSLSCLDGSESLLLDDMWLQQLLHLEFLRQLLHTVLKVRLRLLQGKSQNKMRSITCRHVTVYIVDSCFITSVLQTQTILQNRK